MCIFSSYVMSKLTELLPCDWLICDKWVGIEFVYIIQRLLHLIKLRKSFKFIIIIYCECISQPYIITIVTRWRYKQRYLEPETSSSRFVFFSVWSHLNRYFKHLNT